MEWRSRLEGNSAGGRSEVLGLAAQKLSNCHVAEVAVAADGIGVEGAWTRAYHMLRTEVEAWIETDAGKLREWQVCHSPAETPRCRNSRLDR